jgi:hypothetical protein
VVLLPAVTDSLPRFPAYVNELSDAAKEKQSADEPILLAVYATAGEVLQRCVAENLQSLKVRHGERNKEL